MSSTFPHGRLEERFHDKKPLFSRAEALAEANRCLYCHDAPCIQACPTHIDVPSFIRKIAHESLTGAARTILTANVLGYSCAKVCPVEVLCVGACVYNLEDVPPIQIGRLQRYATEHFYANGRPLLTPKPKIGKRVALVGAGPASLSCAAYLALEGVDAELFEKRPFAGGLNATGIAPYKMTAEDSQREVEFVRSLGVKLCTGVEVDAEGAERLVTEYDAVFLGPGLGGDRKLNVPGEEGPGVLGATEWIERMKLRPDPTLLAGIKRVVVVGGGNTALDAVQELSKLGVSDVTLVYRRTEAEMKAYEHERAGARQEGVRFLFARLPARVARQNERLTGLLVLRSHDGRAVEGSEELVPADLVLLAIGQSRLSRLASFFPGVAMESGRLVVDEARRTGNPKVWAGGDAVNGGKEVVNAVEDGKLAAQAMLRSFGRDVTLERPPRTAAPYETTTSH